MMNPAERYAALKLLVDSLKPVLEEAAAAASLYREMVGAKSLETGWGLVSVTRRKPQVRLDPTQFLSWVRENRPAEIVETVRPSFETAWRAHLVVDGDTVIDPDTGEIAPYAAAVPGSEYLAFRADKEARGEAEAAVAARWEDLVWVLSQPELPQGEEASL